MLYKKKEKILLTNVQDSNEIADLPPVGTYSRQSFETPEEIQVELDHTHGKQEAEFRAWLIKNKPKNALMTAIETSTATGVPDIFCCHNGRSSWIECKVIARGAPRIRGTQYVYLKKLIAAGGHARIVVQRLSNKYKPSSITIYDAAKVTAVPPALFVARGQDMVFHELMPYEYNGTISRPELRETLMNYI